jgi:SAM-dependent methyltransferase
MNAEEIVRMAASEESHWWYRGLRDMIGRTLRAPRFRMPLSANVLDAGCGTGENLRLLHGLVSPAYLGGFDLSPLAVRHSQAKVEGADVYVGDLRDPELHVDHLDLVLSCDVLSIAGVGDCLSGMARLVKRLRRGGLLILHLPAYPWLYSAHDVAIDTRDRVTAAQVRRLLTDLGLSIEMISYRLCCLLPAIVLARLPSILCRTKRVARSDLRPSPAWVNTSLGRLLCAENAAIVRGTRFPWGSSVYAVGRMA